MADILAEKTLAQAKFALDIRNRMRKEHEYDLSGQFFRATSSVGANLAEAHSPHSVQSFLAKTLIARQKCSEAQYWLELLKHGKYISEAEYSSLKGGFKEIYALLCSCIITARNNKKRRNQDFAS